MAKVKNLDAVRRNLDGKIREFKTDKTELNKAAKVIQNELRRDIRTGKDVNGNPIKEVSTSWGDRRLELLNSNKSSKYFRGGVSGNATFTGELVRSIVAKVQGIKIEIFGEGKHSRYKDQDGDPIGKVDSSNDDILKSFRKRGNPLLGVTDSAKEKIAIQFRRFLRRKSK